MEGHCEAITDYTDKSKIYMKDILKELEDIAEKLDTINTQMNDEERVWAEELADRKRQGLTGNEWMDRHGMSHLKVPYLT